MYIIAIRIRDATVSNAFSVAVRSVGSGRVPAIVSRAICRAGRERVVVVANRVRVISKRRTTLNLSLASKARRRDAFRLTLSRSAYLGSGLFLLRCKSDQKSNF